MPSARARPKTDERCGAESDRGQGTAVPSGEPASGNGPAGCMNFWAGISLRQAFVRPNGRRSGVERDPGCTVFSAGQSSVSFPWLPNRISVCQASMALRLLMSLRGESPKARLYSLLNWATLS